MLASFPMLIPNVVATSMAVLGFAIYSAMQLLDLKTSIRHPRRYRRGIWPGRSVGHSLLAAAGIGAGAMLALYRRMSWSDTVVDTIWMLVVLLFWYSLMIGLTLPIFSRIHRLRARARECGVPEERLRMDAVLGTLLIPVAIASAVATSWLIRFG